MRGDRQFEAALTFPRAADEDRADRIVDFEHLQVLPYDMLYQYVTPAVAASFSGIPYRYVVLPCEQHCLTRYGMFYFSSCLPIRVCQYT